MTSEFTGGCPGGTEGLRLRRARREDLVVLGPLKLRASMAWGDMPTEVAGLPEAREVPEEHLQFVIVAEHAGEIVGFATVLPGDALEAELEDLFVAPEAWRQGVGARLVAEAALRAAGLGADTLRVVGNARAEGFYTACGFETVGVVQTQFEPAPEMRKRLAPGQARS